MLIRMLTFSLLFSCLCFGQGLPDRDELIAQFKNESTTESAVRELYKSFGMGGLRTVMNQVNDLPLERRLQFVRTFQYMDFNRFFDNVVTNLESATDPETRGMWLMLLAREARTVDPAAFEKYASDESQDIRVRLAAMSGLCQRQDPDRFKRFYAIADKAVVDPVTGRNDLCYSLLTKENQALFFYTRSELEKGKISQGRILIALAMADAGDAQVFTKIIEATKDRKLLPLLIDSATRVGGVAILDMMSQQKLFKKDVAEIDQAKPAAAALAGHLSKLYENQTHDVAKVPMAAVLPLTAKGSGSNGKHGGFAIVRVDAEGNVTVVEKQTPFGGSEQFNNLPSKTIPAYLEWEPQESYYLLTAP